MAHFCFQDTGWMSPRHLEHHSDPHTASRRKPEHQSSRSRANNVKQLIKQLIRIAPRRGRNCHYPQLSSRGSASSFGDQLLRLRGWNGLDQTGWIKLGKRTQTVYSWQFLLRKSHGNICGSSAPIINTVCVQSYYSIVPTTR